MHWDFIIRELINMYIFRSISSRTTELFYRSNRPNKGIKILFISAFDTKLQNDEKINKSVNKF